MTKHFKIQILRCLNLQMYGVRYGVVNRHDHFSRFFYHRNYCGTTHRNLLQSHKMCTALENTIQDNFWKICTSNLPFNKYSIRKDVKRPKATIKWIKYDWKWFFYFYRRPTYPTLPKVTPSLLSIYWEVTT